MVDLNVGVGTSQPVCDVISLYEATKKGLVEGDYDSLELPLETLKTSWWKDVLVMVSLVAVCLYFLAYNQTVEQNGADITLNKFGVYVMCLLIFFKMFEIIVGRTWIKHCMSKRNELMLVVIDRLVFSTSSGVVVDPVTKAESLPRKASIQRMVATIIDRQWPETK